jgi:DNA-directed RNA polymerase subunit RPC12/RpoP
MTTYKCFKCGNKVKNEDLKKRFVCPECGKNIFYKEKTKAKKVKAI